MFVVECIVGGRLVRVLVRATDATDARGAAGRKLAMSDVRGAITITDVRRVVERARTSTRGSGLPWPDVSAGTAKGTIAPVRALR